MLVGKECVERTVCKPPLVPNAAGTACVRDQPEPKHERPCEQRLRLDGGHVLSSVRPTEKEDPRERPGIRIPGGFPGLGGGGGGGGAGPTGGGAPGKR